MKKGRREFWVETGGVCRDCGLREILTIDGWPRRHKWYGFRMSSRCEGCGGSGRAGVRVENLQRLIDGLAAKRKRPLTGRQKLVIELRYGLKDGQSYTTREVGELMGISHQQVSRHEQAGRTKIESV